MKNKWVKRAFTVLAVVFGIVLLINFSLNIWLKNQLPDYIKKNTDYKISYKSLSVDLGTGNIFASGITVNSKNPQNTQVLGLQGTVDTLKISRFGIYDAVFKKRISSTDLLLVNPVLNIILAKPKDRKNGRKNNPPVFENIKINNGSISIFKYTKEKFLGIDQLDLDVEHLQITEESTEKKLPVSFDTYSVRGRNFFFRPDEVYVLGIDQIHTSAGQMTLDNFRLTPVLSLEEFKKNHPRKTKMFKFSIPKINFKDIVLKNDKVSLANAGIYNPVITVYTTNAVVRKSDKDMRYGIHLEDVKLSNAEVQIIKPGGMRLFSGKNLNLDLNKAVFDKETSKEVIPVRYADFRFSGKELHLTDRQDIFVQNISLNPKKGQIRNITAKPVASGSSVLDFSVNMVDFNINTFEFKNKKLNLDIQDFTVDGINGKIKTGKTAQNKKSDVSGIQFPLNIRKLSVKNSNFTYDKEGQPLSFKNLNANAAGISLVANKAKTGMAVNVKNYALKTTDFTYRTKFYNMTASLLDLNKNKIRISRFAMTPLVSRAQFIKMIPVESDLYDLKASEITAAGNWELFSENKFVHASSVGVSSADANIFRSKIPADDPKEKLLYSQLLRNIKIPLFIDHLYLKNSLLEYEEDTPKSSGPGKLTFKNFNLTAHNLNSAKMKGKPTQVSIAISCLFMETSPLSVNWSFNTADRSDSFRIAGQVLTIPAASINAFIVPYLHVSAEGVIQQMLFDFKGNPKGLNGTFNLKHKDLKVSILDKDSQEKKGVLSAVANIFVKTDSDRFPESVLIENVERDPTKSFFNLFWKGIEDGLKKSLIGIDIAKAEKAVKSTATAVKDVKEAMKDNRKEPAEAQKPDAEKERGLLKNVFKKKEKSETL